MKMSFAGLVLQNQLLRLPGYSKVVLLQIPTIHYCTKDAPPIPRVFSMEDTVLAMPYHFTKTGNFFKTFT